MAKIEVSGHGKLKVLSSLGYVHDVGMYVKEVERADGEPMKVVKRGGVWTPWTARDRVRPIVEDIVRRARIRGAMPEGDDADAE